MVNSNRKDDRSVEDRDALKQRLVAAYDAEVDQVLAACDRGGLRPEEVLEHCEEAGKHAIARLYEAASERAARRERRPTCPAGCGPMARHLRWHRPVLSVNGEWRGVFQRYRCERCGRGACPSYDQWLRFACTPAALAAALSFVADEPYEKAERKLGLFGLHLSDNTLQRIVDAIGGEREAERRAEAEAVLALEREVPAISRPQRLYVQADARSVRVDGQERMVYLGVVFETSAEGRWDPEHKPEPERVSLVAHRDFQVFQALLTAETQRRGIGEAAEVVLIGDGGPGIWPLLEGLAPMWVKQTAILDWWHLTENLAKAVRAVWGEGFNDLCFQRLKNSAWVGDQHHLVGQLQDLAERATGDEAEKQVRQVLAYVREHRDRMSYQSRDLDGYQVGSGQIESCCKQVGLRIRRGAAMDWSERGLRAFLTVLADELTDPVVRRQYAA